MDTSTSDANDTSDTSDKSISDIVIPGRQVTVVWEANPRAPGSVMSNSINGQKTAKIVLPSSTGRALSPKPGESWECEIERITNPQARNRGAIIVVPIRKKCDVDLGDVWVDESVFEVMLAVLQDPSKNLFLEGIQGVGKTTIAEAAARTLGREFRLVNGSEIKKSSTMYGRPQQKATANGQLIWDYADTFLITCVREALAHPEIDYQLFIDEYTRMDPDARDGFLRPLAGGDRAFTTSKPEVIPIPSNLYWLAAGNVGDGFTVQDQDKANMDRWEIVEVRRMPYEVELAHCLRKYPHCPKVELEKALTIVHKLIAITQRMRWSSTISVRRTESLAMFLAKGINTKTAMIHAIANQFQGRSNEPNSERARVIGKIEEALNGVDIAA